ncbi:MAG: type II toxin-antitoxin system RelE/ParE family toxin [Candidatus Binatus sp.]|uniref:type II toxin-antitoxin system RelE/ParE family toxin n=1 Tax=Candidatus Binatus sp. TaxID=2811406 RepID=UPI003C7577B5
MALGKAETLKPVVWVRSSKDDLKKFPRTAQSHLGFALKVAQSGGKHPDAKPMKGFGGASVIEIVEDYDVDTYRAVYTVKFAEAIYVLHAFQKKSNSGIATTKRDLHLIEERLRRAKELHALKVYDKAKR